MHTIQNTPSSRFFGVCTYTIVAHPVQKHQGNTSTLIFLHHYSTTPVVSCCIETSIQLRSVLHDCSFWGDISGLRCSEIQESKLWSWGHRNSGGGFEAVMITSDFVVPGFHGRSECPISANTIYETGLVYWQIEWSKSSKMWFSNAFANLISLPLFKSSQYKGRRYRRHMGAHVVMSNTEVVNSLRTCWHRPFSILLENSLNFPNKYGCY